jgi:gamma-butyrobetaine dioxygenase
MIGLREFDADGAWFTDARGIAHRLGTADLVALAQEGRDARSLQRVPGFLRPRGSVTACDRVAAGWQFGFADGSLVTIAESRLQALFASETLSVPRRMWCAADSAPPVHDYQAVMAEPAARMACLRQVLTLGYARLGGVPQVPGTVARFLASFGPVRETNYGTLFDVRVQPDPANLADTALPLLPHTDNPYRNTPPDLQALHALVAAPDGGETWLVDGLAIVAHLRRTAPDALALLAQVPVRFAWADAHWRLAAVEPVIGLAPDGALHRLRVNSRSLDRPVEPDPARRAAWWAAWDQLEVALADPAFARTFALGAGDLVIMDNRRVLHGRTGFTGATGGRHLQGAYADIDGLTSEVLRLAQAGADAAVDALGTLFLAPDMDDSYGEAMSIREHMLRSAEIAAARGLGEHAVAAALLHDIGWARDADFPPPHERAAADRLRPVFGPRVADPVLWHVEAKRYLVARRPDYHDRLSPASRDTLRQQGGPMDAAECARFEALPDKDVYCALRLVDDAGKDMDTAHTAWADYVALLKRLAVRHLLHQE